MKFGAVVLGGAILFGGVLTAASVEVIGQGHAGVVYDRSHGIEDKTLGQGWHFVSPFKRVTEYPVSTETVKVKSFKVQTKDGKPLSVSLSYDYANELEKLPYIYNKFKGQDSEVIQDGWLETRIKKATLTVFSKYSVLEVFQHQGEINAKIEKEIKSLVSKEGFVVDSVTLGAPSPDTQTAQAIQAVVNAQQKLEQLQIEKQQAVVEAESKRISAEGEAKANEILRKSLSPEIVEYKSIEKWNGSLPQVTGGVTPFVNVQK